MDGGDASGAAAVFELPIAVQADDIDGRAHVNNIVYLRWVQDAAAAHWFAAATAEQQAEYVWVVVRHEIDYLRPAVLGDSLVARTHVGAASGARFDRFVEIVRSADGTVLARARSMWAALDATTGRPRRVDAALRARFMRPPEG
ncbi:MAG TPA: thioesterase family protein [Chthonomonadaceae bacterium]|nr:thioesterase family protein [Chthonomonadaceae bacterium]